MVSKWFKGAELSFALGLNICVSRLGSVLNAAIVPAVYESYGLGIALLVGLFVCLFSLANAFGLCSLDRKSESKEEKEEAKNASSED
jgi:predicted MFS family arabinose efflux permease